ncbi:MAG: dihydroneopterin aldolase [Candidatus Omnitrophica bacterium]|nr:dihydroneopterin aldolase [Candidatus Omnitrophota bacterium]
MAIIHINDLKLQAIIGTNPDERKNLQDIAINISFEYDATKAATSDELNDAVDYQLLEQKIINFVKNAKFQLLETLTDRVLSIVLEDPKVLSARVLIDKPNALNSANTVGVEMERKRS